MKAAGKEMDREGEREREWRGRERKWRQRKWRERQTYIQADTERDSD